MCIRDRDKKGIITYAGGPKGWHKMEKIGAINMSHAKPDDHLKIKTYGRSIAYLKDFAKLPGFGQSVLFKKESVKEGKLNSKIKQAILIAIEMSGNMTGAAKKIEKIKKGLSKDKKVKAALRMANENKLNENPAAIAAAQRMVVQSKAGKKISVNTARSQRYACLLYTSPSPRDVEESRMPSSA